MSALSPVHAEHVAPVRSRISWGAILAGAVLALSLYFLFALLGSAIGFSLGDKLSPHSLTVAAAAYAIGTAAVCLFLGGCVASQLTVGEDHMEGSLYGIFVWATVLAALLGLGAAGVRIGLSAMTGVATVAAGTPPNWEASARQAGVPQDRIDEWKAKAKEVPAAIRETVENPKAQEAAAMAATRVMWYAFFGVWISMMAAAAGGYVGSGSRIERFGLLAVSSWRPVKAAPHILITPK